MGINQPCIKLTIAFAKDQWQTRFCISTNQKDSSRGSCITLENRRGHC